jgi:hypothetical protein
MKFERVLDVGKTQYGNRQVVVVQEGALSGVEIVRALSCRERWTFELKLSNGTIEVEQVLVVKTSDGKYRLCTQRRDRRGFERRSRCDGF